MPPAEIPSNALQLKDFIAPTITSLALVFTVASFWWSNWRRGRLRVDRPRTFAYHEDQKNSMILLPLAITNTGARIILVTAVRIKLGGTKKSPRVAWMIRERQGPEPKSGDGVMIAANFTIEGRKSQVRFSEFEFSPPLKLRSGQYPVRVEALMAHKRRWRKIGELKLTIDSAKITENAGHYIAYDNAGSLPQ
jgi:hypothetical protein